MRGSKRTRKSLCTSRCAAAAWKIALSRQDPFKRVDVLRSSCRIRIEVGGVVLAETTRAMLLYETGLPRRTYIPPLDVKMELLKPSSLRTQVGRVPSLA